MSHDVTSYDLASPDLLTDAGIPDPRNDTIGWRLVARTVPASARRSSSGAPPVTWHSLEDLYTE
jgi:hypothetical protein